MTATPADLRTRDFRKILLIKLSAVGDVVHTIPVLNKLRAALSGRPNRLAGVFNDRRVFRSASGHHQCGRIRLAGGDWAKPWSVPRSSLRQISAAPRWPVARRRNTISSSTCKVSCAAACSPWRPGRRCGSVSANRSRAEWEEASRASCRMKRARCLAGRPRGSWLAYSHFIPLPLA